MEQEAVVDEVTVRRWLRLLRDPDRLNTPEIRALLRNHGRLPRTDNSQDIGRAAAKLLVETIDRMKPAAGLSEREALPYRVLRTCFVDGAKLTHAARALEISERQLSRERARAIALLAERLASGPGDSSYFPEVIPALDNCLPRPELTMLIQQSLDRERTAHVFGPPGIGKTSLVADFAASFRHVGVWWHRFRPGVNDSIKAILLELGHWLDSHGFQDLRRYVRANLNELDVTVASRLAVQALGRTSSLIVLDDFQVAERDREIGGFLEEIAARAEPVQIATLSRRRPEDALSGGIEVPPLELMECDGLLKRLGVALPLGLVARIHLRTGGNPHLVRLAVPWLKPIDPSKADEILGDLADHLQMQTYLLSTLTELLDVDDRHVLGAASIFRGRFSDDALAHVAERTLGGVQDASQRLARSYVATRSQGSNAFLHATVRDYVYERLEPDTRVRLHLRAAAWYHATGDENETRYHRDKAGLENP